MKIKNITIIFELYKFIIIQSNNFAPRNLSTLSTFLIIRYIFLTQRLSRFERYDKQTLAR